MMHFSKFQLILPGPTGFVSSAVRVLYRSHAVLPFSLRGLIQACLVARTKPPFVGRYLRDLCGFARAPLESQAANPEQIQSRRRQPISARFTQPTACCRANRSGWPPHASKTRDRNARPAQPLLCTVRTSLAILPDGLHSPADRRKASGRNKLAPHTDREGDRLTPSRQATAGAMRQVGSFLPLA
jgi:hypothetical protein